MSFRPTQCQVRTASNITEGLRPNSGFRKGNLNAGQLCLSPSWNFNTRRGSRPSKALISSRTKVVIGRALETKRPTSRLVTGLNGHGWPNSPSRETFSYIIGLADCCLLLEFHHGIENLIRDTHKVGPGALGGETASPYSVDSSLEFLVLLIES